VAVVLAAVIGIALAAGGNRHPVAGQTSPTVPASTPGPTSPPATTATPPPSATSAPSLPGIGGSIRLRGQKAGEVVSVKLVGVTDPAVSRLFTPDKGKRYVAIDFTVTNVGSLIYKDSPSNGCLLTDAQGVVSPDLIQVVDPTLDQLSLHPGQSKTGLVTFEVPKGVALRSVQFIPDSGAGLDSGTWTLPS